VDKKSPGVFCCLPSGQNYFKPSAAKGSLNNQRCPDAMGYWLKTNPFQGKLIGYKQ
jgi:hypothetical protein